MSKLIWDKCSTFILHVLAKIINFLGWVTDLIEIEKKENLFANLPEDIKREILGRLHLRSVIRCRYVCRSWRDLIEGVEFATLYFSKPGLVFSSNETYEVRGGESKFYFEFCMIPSFYKNQFNVRRGVVINSVNGLILVKDKCPNLLYMCNPITLEYVELPYQPTCNDIFGYGVSKFSRHYKVLCVSKLSCYVCTLGEECWRSISEAAPGVPIMSYDIATFLNGNLHWLVSDVEEKNKFICCFDLETELFKSFPLPSRVYGSDILREYRLCSLQGRLCFCDTYDSYNFAIWLMHNYGDENSWVKEYTFQQPIAIWQSVDNIMQRFLPLKVLENGDLFYYNNNIMFIYSRKTERVEPHSFVVRSMYHFSNIAIYTPSFHSLKAMGIHNVRSLTSLHHMSFSKRQRWLSRIANRVPKLSCFGIW